MKKINKKNKKTADHNNGLRFDNRRENLIPVSDT